MPFEIARPLADLQAAALARINDAVGAARGRWLTLAAGQEITYASKRADALAYAAAGYPENATPFVWVVAEASARGITPAQAADFILATAAAWASKGAAIEGARQAAKLAIKSATNGAEIYAAESTFRDALAAL